MVTGDSLIDKADTLLQRRRVFVAGGSAHQFSPPPRMESVELPVLTEVVDTLSPLPLEQTVPPERIEALAKALLLERLPASQQQLAVTLSGWLDTELPQVVMRVVDGLTDQIIAQVTAEARASLLPRLQTALEADHAAHEEQD
jgi:hypothetical protein